MLKYNYGLNNEPRSQNSGQSVIPETSNKGFDLLKVLPPSVIITLLLVGCGIVKPPSAQSEPKPTSTSPGITANETIGQETLPQMSIDDYSLREGYPSGMRPIVEAFGKLALKNGLNVDNLGNFYSFHAQQGDQIIDFHLLPVAVLNDLADSNGEFSAPNPVFYLAYQDVEGTLKSGYAVGERIEQDEHGHVFYAYQMLDESSWQQLKNPQTITAEDPLTFGQLLWAITLKDDITVEQARQLKQQVISGQRSSEQMLEDSAIGITFSSPEKPDTGITVPITKAEENLQRKGILASIKNLFLVQTAHAIELSATATQTTESSTIKAEDLLGERFPDVPGFEEQKLLEVVANLNMDPSGVAINYFGIAKNGRNFVFAFDRNSNIPLLYHDKFVGSTEWKTNERVGLVDITSIHGINIGGAVDKSEDYSNPKYWGTIDRDFNTIFIGGGFKISSLERWGYNLPDSLLTEADKYNLDVMIHPAFWHQDQPDISIDQVPEFMQKRISYLVDKAMVLVNTGQTPTINFFNEALWIWEGKVGWEDSIYYKKYGDSLLVESYLMFIDEIELRKKLDGTPVQVGEDIYLAYSDYYLHKPNPKAKKVYQELEKLKQQVAERTGRELDEVKIGVSLQMRFDPQNIHPYKSTGPNNSAEKGWRPVPTESELSEMVELFSQIGPVYFTETNVINANPEERNQIFFMLIKIMREKGINLLLFEQPLRFHGKDESSSEHVGFYTNSYEVTDQYMDFLKLLFAGFVLNPLQ